MSFQSDFFVLRTPLLPFSTLRQLKDLPEMMAVWLENPLFLEAIYIASPDLYQQLLRWQLGEVQKEKEIRKLQEAFFEYITRMSFRCTPFGLFAGCTLGTFGDRNDIRFPAQGHLLRHMRLDMDFSTILFLHFMKDPAIYRTLRYQVNNSLYKAAGAYRYTEYRFVAGSRRSHHLVSIGSTPVLNKIIKAAAVSIPYADLLTIITAMGYDQEDAIDYLDQLIQSQVLTSEIEPNVTGPDYVERLITVLDRVGAARSPLIEKLRSMQTRIRNINQDPEKTTFYRSIFEDWQKEGLNLHKSHLFQIDLYKNADSCMLDPGIREKVSKGVEVLSKITPVRIDHPNMQVFKRAFYERYDNRMVPLTEALDSEVGIGYRKARSLADTFRTESGIEFDSRTEFVFRKFKSWLAEKEKHIDLSDEDLEPFEDKLSTIAGSIGVTINLIREDGQEKVVLRTVSGPSGANLLGRFAHTVHELEQGLRQLCEKEAALQPERLFAEIVHLPEGRMGNVLARPVLRQYEIPYLAASPLDPEYQVLISDLYLFIRNQRLVLYSKRHQKEVVPRLSSAHNFTNGLPLYNFLCDLQYESLQTGIYWNWGFLGSEARLPRVQYKDVILYPASWNLYKKVLDEMAALKDAKDLPAAFTAFREKYGIPDQVVFCESDNRIWLDLKDEYPIRYLIKQAQKNGRIHLEENFWHFDDQPFTNEIIIPFVREAVSDETSVAPIVTENKVQRIFSPGSEWLYFKLYGSLGSTDRLLNEQLFPLLGKLKRERVIDKWFFLRYRDPKDHLRIRLHIPDSTQIGAILQRIYNRCNRLLQTGEIANIQLDTYTREIERYGSETMSLSEDYFCINSEMTAQLMKLLGATLEGDLPMYAVILGTESILNAFGYTLEEKIEYVKKNMAIRDLSKSEKESIAAYYRDHNKIIYALLAEDWAFLSDTSISVKALRTISKICRRSAARLSPIARSIRTAVAGQPDRLDQLMGSYIHMFVNKSFSDYQLEKEYRLYVFLNKLYPSIKARTNAPQPKPQLITPLSSV
ncbi:MAG: lantibiotic dehydratase [Bacteroidetes bacterium]|nr:lantibiotic dehydratase [Bacteroidota bacterium]